MCQLESILPIFIILFSSIEGALGTSSSLSRSTSDQNHHQHQPLQQHLTPGTNLDQPATSSTSSTTVPPPSGSNAIDTDTPSPAPFASVAISPRPPHLSTSSAGYHLYASTAASSTANEANDFPDALSSLRLPRLGGVPRPAAGFGIAIGSSTGAGLVGSLVPSPPSSPKTTSGVGGLVFQLPVSSSAGSTGSLRHGLPSVATSILAEVV